jgi:hypothetical protein
MQKIALCMISVVFLAMQGTGMEAVHSYTVTRNENPWDQYTGSYEEEQAGRVIAAVAMVDAFERVPHLESYALQKEPFLAIDRAGRRVVLNERFFSTMNRVDVTRIRAGERQEMGTVRDQRLIESPRSLIAFLIESQLIISYVHIEATLVLEKMLHTAEEVTAFFTGTHTFYTNERNDETLAFRVHLNKKNGLITVLGPLSH